MVWNNCIDQIVFIKMILVIRKSCQTLHSRYHHLRYILAPFLADWMLHQLAQDEGNYHPLAAPILVRFLCRRHFNRCKYKSGSGIPLWRNTKFIKQRWTRSQKMGLKSIVSNCLLSWEFHNFSYLSWSWYNNQESGYPSEFSKGYSTA